MHLHMSDPVLPPGSPAPEFLLVQEPPTDTGNVPVEVAPDDDDMSPSPFVRT